MKWHTIDNSIFLLRVHMHAISDQSTEGRTVTDQPLVNGEPATLG